MRIIKTTTSKKSAWLFLVILLTGWVAVFLTKSSIHNYAYSNGRELLAMYIPLPLSILFVTIVCWWNMPGKWLGILLFALLVIPFYDVWFNAFGYFSQDDGYRYTIAAKNIVASKTLWGSDDLLFNTNRKVYMVQPGYRYYLALVISVFGNENRLSQLMGMGLYLTAVIYLLTQVQRVTIDKLFRKGFLLFLMLSSFFAAKNILMGLTEWMVLTILLFFVSAYLSGRIVIAIILLALVPFLRQNLLIAAVLFFIWMMWQQRRWLLYSVLFVLILLLPVYHNLYYAGEWKFFSTYYNTSGYLVLDFEGSTIVRMIKTFFYHIILYAGVDWLLHNVLANALAIAFVPLGTALYIWCIYRLKGKDKWIFLLITLAAITPTLIFGGRAYYPRFEWVNLLLSLLCFWMVIYRKQSRAGEAAAGEQILATSLI